MLGIEHNDELDPLRYDGHVDASVEVARKLADLVPMGSCVLDVGCGTGSLSRLIADTRNAKLMGSKQIRTGATAARGRGLEVCEQ